MLLLKIEKKESKTLETFQKLLEWITKPLVQSEQARLEQ